MLCGLYIHCNFQVRYNSCSVLEATYLLIHSPPFNTKGPSSSLFYSGIAKVTGAVCIRMLLSSQIFELE